MFVCVCVSVCVYNFQELNQKPKSVKVRVRPHLLFRVSMFPISIFVIIFYFLFFFLGNQKNTSWPDHCYILQPSEHLGDILPDTDASFELFDRVVNVKMNAAVPFGLRGTVTGIHRGKL